MLKACLPLAALAIVFLQGATTPVIAQAPVPLSEPPNTLWRFLGIPQTMTGTYDALANRRGNRPGLERTGRDARVRRIADPAFLDPNAPPLLKTAAQIKMQEDLAPQKIKALEYLGSIGCGCYDKDGEVTAAMLEGLRDCTEEVRLEAVEVISQGACSQRCEFCSQRSCCKPALANELDKLANGQDEYGCWLEPSGRVRAAAAQALAACGPIAVQSGPLQQQQGGSEDLPPMPEVGSGPPAPPQTPSELPSPQATRRLPPIRSSDRASSVRTGSPHPTFTENQAAERLEQLYGSYQQEGRSLTTLVSHPQSVFDPPRLPDPEEFVPEAAATEANGSPGPGASITKSGVIEGIDKSQGIVRVRFNDEGQVSAGTPVTFIHKAFVGETHVSGRVDQWDSGLAVVRPYKSELTGRLAAGDVAILYVSQPVPITR